RRGRSRPPLPRRARGPFRPRAARLYRAMVTRLSLRRGRREPRAHRAWAGGEAGLSGAGASVASSGCCSEGSDRKTAHGWRYRFGQMLNRRAVPPQQGREAAVLKPPAPLIDVVAHPLAKRSARHGKGARLWQPVEHVVARIVLRAEIARGGI